MSKKIYISIFSLLLIGLVWGILPVKAQVPDQEDVGQTEEVEMPGAGITPDSPFYFLERFKEGVETFFTFGHVAKAERYAKLAAERIAEAKAVIDKGKPESAEKALIRYQKQLGKSLARAEQAQIKGESAAKVTDIVARATAKHMTVLEEILEKVPEQAKSAILQAREVSKTGQVRALENLAKEKPERAANLNIRAIQRRLEKIKRQVKQGGEEETERVLADFDDFRAVLEKIGKNNKEVVADLISEKMSGQIEGLEEMENELRNMSPKIAKKARVIKTNAINGQIDVLRSLAQINPEKATKIFSQAARKRLNRIKQKTEDENTEQAGESVEEFEKYAAFGQEISGIARDIGKYTTTIDELITTATSHHLKILSEVYGKAPEQAKQGLERAMGASLRGRTKAVEFLKERGAMGDIPEEAPIPVKIRERIKEQMRKQEVLKLQQRPETPPAEGRPEEPRAKQRPLEMQGIAPGRSETPPAQGRAEEPQAKERPEQVTETLRVEKPEVERAKRRGR